MNIRLLITAADLKVRQYNVYFAFWFNTNVLNEQPVNRILRLLSLIYLG